MVRKLRITLLLALLVIGLVSTFSLSAAPPYETETIYYSESAKINECGYRYVTCGGIYRSGCITSWYDTYVWGPC
ncbi:MAG TPA: hypothetical protein VGF69_23615 [Thermoanaerobaculia bacterium]